MTAILYASSESSNAASATPKKQPEKAKFDLPYLKLDIKFELPTYNGELNVEKLDDWIKQIEVYCRIQKLLDDQVKIQLATFCLKGIALIWWESKTQEDLLTKGKIISSWYEFTATLIFFLSIRIHTSSHDGLEKPKAR